jgi:uncharacterized protein (TIGR02118 family)
VGIKGEKMIVNVVTTQCQPEDDQKFNHWYNTVHVPMLLKFKRLQGVIRYKTMSEPGQPVQYIAVYHFATKKAFEDYVASQELAAAVKDMGETWGDKVKLVSKVAWEQLKAWEN